MNNEIAVNTGTGTSTGIDIFNQLDSMARLADMMSKAQNSLPVQYQGNPGDCLAVVIQGQQWGMSPFLIAQKTSFINGNISYEAQLVNSVINKLAPVKHRIKYEFFGDWNKVVGKVKPGKSAKGKDILERCWNVDDEVGLGVKVYTTLNGEDEPRELDVLLVQAQVRNSPLWVSDPKQQLCYLAVKKWSRLFTPDVIMGVYTPDEMVDMPVKSAITEVVDIEYSINDCKSIDELVSLWSTLSKDEKEIFTAVKDAKKDALING